MMSSTEWPLASSEAGRGTKPCNILALHCGGMIDEADSRLGSSDRGWLPGLGHPECFPLKGPAVPSSGLAFLKEHTGCKYERDSAA